jgi:RNA polymerase sigma factor (sigma-70 family)
MASAMMSEASDPPLAWAVEEIFKSHARLVYRTAYGVTGSHEDAEDILQAVFVRLLQGPVPPGLKNNPEAYLYRSAVNRSLDVVRFRRRHVLCGEAGCDKTATVASESADDNLHRELYQAVAELKPESAQIVILRYIHNKSDAEIARMLGVSRGTIALRLFRSRARLKQLLHARLGDSQ